MRGGNRTIAKLARRASLGVVSLLALLAVGSGQGASSASAELRQNGNRIVATGEMGNAYFGFSVALSADGDTALVGGIYDNANKGAAWVFRRSGSGWTQEAKLTPTDETGPGHFGFSVALSADGNVALVGAPQDNGGRGSAWVFTRVTQPGAAVPWEQRPRLAGYQCAQCGPPTQFGASVALSADGGVAVIGGPQTTTDKGLGAAWTAVRSGNAWVVNQLTMRSFEYSANALFGAAVAVAGDGMSALIGAPGAGARGVVNGFVRFTAAEPFQETSERIGAPGSYVKNFGSSIALSSDGRTAVVGAPRTDDRGNAFAYGRDQFGRWLFQGELAPNGTFPAVSSYGSSVALADDGDTALVGGSESSGQRGAMWTFVRDRAQWTRRSGAIEAGGEVGAGFFGTSLDLAADGNSAFVGAPQHDGGLGAVWSFTDPPVVTSLTPRSGPTAGGTTVVLRGTNFDDVKTVRFGAKPATSFEVLNATRIDAVAPAGAAGSVDVTAGNSGGPSPTSATTRFTYLAPGTPPPPPPPATTAGTPPPPPPPPPGRTTNQRPTTRILSAQFRGARLYVRIRVCDDSRKNLSILERDSKPGVRSFTRRFATLRPPKPCAALTRSWIPAQRFRHGRYTVTVTARDKSGKTSLPARRTFLR